MIQLFKNIFLLIQVSRKLNSEKTYFRNVSRKHISVFLDKELLSNDGSLSKGIQFKLKDYPLEGLFAANLIAELHSKTLSESEQKHSCYCGAILALGDAFCDDSSLSVESIAEMLSRPEEIKPETSIEKLFISIYLELLKGLSESSDKSFKTAISKGFEAEKMSRHLIHTKENKEKVLNISREKGGRSLLMYRALLSYTFYSNEENVLWLVGAFTQLIDDTFDLYWDFKSDTQTSATKCDSLEELSVQLIAHYEEIKSALKNSDIPEKQAYILLFVMNIFLHGTILYISQIKRLVNNSFQKKKIVALSEKEIKFKQMKAGNILSIIPKAIRFSFHN